MSGLSFGHNAEYNHDHSWNLATTDLGPKSMILVNKKKKLYDNKGA